LITLVLKYNDYLGFDHDNKKLRAEITGHLLND